MTQSDSTDLLCAPQDLAELDPAKTAHICIDVQERYFHPEKASVHRNAIENGHEVAERIARIAPLFNQAGLNKTIWVYHIRAGKQFYLVKPDEKAGDEIFAKLNFSAFEGGTLHKRLKELGIETLVLTGGYTSECVCKTARDALKKNYNVIVLADCIQDVGKPFFDKELTKMFSVVAQENGQEKRAVFTVSDTLLDNLKANHVKYRALS